MSTDAPVRSTLLSTHSADSRPPSRAGQRSVSTSRRGSTKAADLEVGKLWAADAKKPWEPCILALDGGGIRGYSSLLIIRDLMHEIYLLEKRLQEEEPIEGNNLPDDEGDLLPCHYFDFMYGTSTGGLISVMLGRLRMSIGECLEQYRVVGDRLFGKRKSSIPLRTKYRHEPLEEAVKDIVGGRKLGSLHPWQASTAVNGGLTVGVETGSGHKAVAEADVPLSKVATREAEGVGDEQATTVFSAANGGANGWAHHGAASAAGANAHDGPRDRADSATSPTTTAKSDYSHSSADNAQVWDPEAPRMCHSCCLTATHTNQVIRAYLLRSYPLYYDDETPTYVTPYNEGADPLEIWQVCRATSAAPFYFEMLQAVIDGELRCFKDGGIRENNPSVAAYMEYQAMFGRRASVERARPALLLSIGTGRSDTQRDGFMATWPGPLGNWSIVRHILAGLENFSILPALLVKFTESEEKHQSMLLTADGETTWYKRLNVSTGLENMQLDDWVKGEYGGQLDAPGGKTLARMEAATRAYLDRERDPNFETYASPRVLIQQTAEKLVRHRRARMQLGGPRWETYVG